MNDNRYFVAKAQNSSNESYNRGRYWDTSSLATCLSLRSWFSLSDAIIYVLQQLIW